MGFFHNHIPVNHDTLPPPAELIEQAEVLARNVETPEEAEEAIARLLPEIAKHSPEARFLNACGSLLEKRRKSGGMLEAWSDLQSLFPRHLLPFKMMMRWFARMHQVEEGLQRLHELCPDKYSDLKQAERAILGLMELKDYPEIDNIMNRVLLNFPNDTSIRLRYIQMLFKQNRLFEADIVIKQIKDRDHLNQNMQMLLSKIETQTEILGHYNIVDSAAVIGKMVETYTGRKLRPLTKNGLGPVVFFTGQLGAGGAERQMTRISSAFQRCYNSGIPIAGQKLLSPPHVCVRHTTPASRSDFFLPILRDAGVNVRILNECPTPNPTEIPELTDNLREMLGFLPLDMQQNTLKLVPYFKEIKAEYAYFWQDGGVLAAAMAALVAGVPRIVTTFRGLPPSQRPELLRPQMPYLYKALYKIPGVSFTANSNSTARAYEEWLELETGSISVIRNAVPAVLPDGDADTHQIWDEIVANSADCSKTVLGIFRYDHNKRPDYWIEIAATYIKQHPDTRFVILGHGTHFNSCRTQVATLGLNNRIFLAGSTKHVGFFLHKADILMHLARMEGLPNVVIEAHLAGTPVLATPAGGTGEILDDGVTGFLLSQSHNPPADEIVAKLEQLLSSPALLEKMGKAAAQHAKSPFLIEHILDRTTALFLNDWR